MPLAEASWVVDEEEPHPWQDRGRELVRLRWTHYAFDETDWDGRENCWVGRNLDTEGPVLLKCAQGPIGDSDRESLLCRLNRLEADGGRLGAELIVAIENGVAPTADQSTGTTLRFVTEAELLDQLIDWREYRNDIRKRMTVAKLSGPGLTISDVFVRPRFEPVGWALDGPSDLVDYLVTWLEEPGPRQLALLGDYGQGKSTAALAFTDRLLNDDTASRVPILIELRGKSPRNMTPLELLGSWGSKHNINPQALMHLHRAGRLLLIFEGFDEMALVGDSEMRLKHFERLWQFCRADAKILITGRPNFFFDEVEMTTALSIGEPMGDDPYCRAMRLSAFELGQIRSALRNHAKSLCDEICGFAEQNGQFRELISSSPWNKVVGGLTSVEGVRI